MNVSVLPISIKHVLTSSINIPDHFLTFGIEKLLTPARGHQSEAITSNLLVNFPAGHVWASVAKQKILKLLEFGIGYLLLGLWAGQV